MADQTAPIVISTDTTSLVLGTGQHNQLLQYYYGMRLQNPADVIVPDNANTVQQGYPAISTSPNNECGQEFSPAYSAFGAADNTGALRVTHADGGMSLELVYDTHRTVTEDANRQVTTITLKDKIYPFRVELNYRAYQKEDVIETWASFTHNEESAVVLNEFPSAELSFSNIHSDYYLTYFHGLWEREHSLVEEKLNLGRKVLENRFGVWSSFGFNPSFMLSLNEPATEATGEVIAGALAWTGAWKITFNYDHGKLFHDTAERRLLSITAGQNDFAGDYCLDPGIAFETPKFILTYTQAGKGEASRNLHRWARKYALRGGEEERPILLNSWEGAYFSFDEEKLLSMMDGVAKMGGEMFVLDDGWFGNGDCARNSCNAGLGDWQVNREKLPNGLSFLADEAERRGLKFGIWVEPEMVNPQSQLFKAHPDWAIQQPNREKIVYRTQLVLDLANPEVQEFVFESVANVLHENPGISYVKWDCNRSIINVGSMYLPKDRQSHLWVDYTNGLYSVYDRLVAEFPDTMFQACASGGGRIDYGILRTHHEFWASDNTDALQRIFIQWGTNHIYPAIATASHVTICPNHQTGRTTPLKFRFDVAMTGRLGLELNPNDMTEDELAYVKSAVAEYKRIRPVVMFGDLYRLVSPYDHDFSSVMYVSEDKSRALVFAYNINHSLGHVQPQIQLRGLDPDRLYKINEINTQDDRLHTQHNGQTMGGDTLMARGLKVHLTKEYDSAAFELTLSDAVVH